MCDVYSSAEVLLQVALLWRDKLHDHTRRVSCVVIHPNISRAGIAPTHKVPLRIVALKSKVIGYPGRDQLKQLAGVMLAVKHANGAPPTVIVAMQVVSRRLRGGESKIVE